MHTYCYYDKKMKLVAAGGPSKRIHFHKLLVDEEGTVPTLDRVRMVPPAHAKYPSTRKALPQPSIADACKKCTKSALLPTSLQPCSR